MSLAVRPSTDATPVVATTMEERVDDTLATLSALPSPVVRSGHVGNNTANIWGWLALARNARLAQVDHNLYGVDEVCLPWMVLGDGGRVAALYDLDGRAIPVLGEHATVARTRIPRRHYSNLALGLAADHLGTDLMAYHFDAAERLARRVNGSRASCDALELVALRPRLTDLARDLVRERRLDGLFDRWVLPTRRGRLIQLKLGPIDYDGGDLRLCAGDGRELFKGSLEELLDQLFVALESIGRRLSSGRREPNLAHPWITSAFGYFAYTLAELEVDPRQEVFWHGGGSTSQYYVNAEATCREYSELRDLLVALGHLPRGWRLRIVPTYCCQLFATSSASLACLEAMVGAWHDLLRAHAAAAARTIGALASTTEPLAVVRGFVAGLHDRWRRALLRHLGDFNALDPNVLPVAHAAGHDHPTYNKYGIAQRRLLELTPRFPAGLGALRWGEAELLVKVLAELDIDRLG